MQLQKMIFLFISIASSSHTKGLEFLDTIDYDSLLPSDSNERDASRKKGYITRTLSDGQQIQLFYSLEGEGKTTLVFLHGFPYSSAQWDNQVLELSKDYRVLTLDIRGMGSSSRAPVSCFQEYIDDCIPY